MRVYLNLRHWVSERANAFQDGLKRLGYTDIHLGIGRGDLLVTWNRIQAADRMANECERSDIPVIVAENASWGAAVPGQWLHITRTRHNTADLYQVGSTKRWDGLEVPLAPWRTGGHGETVVLAQRGIGAPPTAQPPHWVQTQAGRVRPHPGRMPSGRPLREDLAKAGKVITWGSAAAVQAAIWGIPVESHMPNWIGEQNNTDAGRLAMLRRMAWAQWNLEEISSGRAFAHLLGRG